MSGDATNRLSSEPERLWRELAEAQWMLIRSERDPATFWPTALQSALQLSGARSGWIEETVAGRAGIKARMGVSDKEVEGFGQKLELSARTRTEGQVVPVPMPGRGEISPLIVPLRLPDRPTAPPVARIVLLLPAATLLPLARLQTLERYAAFAAVQAARQAAAPTVTDGERHLIDRARLFDRVMHRTLAGMFRSTHAGEILECNPACARAMGFDSPEEMRRINSHSLFLSPSEREALWSDLAEQGGSALIECIRIRKDGQSVRLLQDLQLFSEEPAGEPILHGVFFELADPEAPPPTATSSVNLLRKIIESDCDAVILVDAEAGILYCGPSIERIFGYRPAELVGQNGFDYVHPEDQMMVRAQLRKLIAGSAVVSAEVRLLDRSGVWRWTELTASNHLEDPRLRAILLNYRDITERRQHDEAVFQNERRQQLIFEASGDAIWDWDMRTNTVRISGSFETLFGYRPNEIESNAGWWFRRIHPDDVARMEALLGKNMPVNQQFWSGEFRLIRADGSWAPAFSRGYVVRNRDQVPLRMIGAMTDMTAHHRFHQLLEEVYGNFPIGFLAISPEGLIAYVNSAAQEALGMPGQKLSGMNIFHHEALRAFDFTARVEPALRERTPQHFLEAPGHLPYRLQVDMFPSDAGIVVYLQRQAIAPSAPAAKARRHPIRAIFRLPMRATRAVTGLVVRRPRR